MLSGAKEATQGVCIDLDAADLCIFVWEQVSTLSW